MSVYCPTVVPIHVPENMNSSAHDPDAPVHECGFLLIADMESSTLSKFVLGELEAFKALRTHNRLAINECLTATPVPGVIVNSLGDAIVAKFIATDDSRAALQSCLTAARAIVAAFEQLPALPNKSGPGFRLRSKLLLQHYNAFNYGIRDADDILSDELVGADIDQAFRLAPVAWRLQVLVTDAFMSELMREATLPSGAACDSQALLDRARLARHSGALSPERLRGIEQPLTLNDIHCWVTDAREIARLKGIGQSRRVYALAFERPQALIDRGDKQRLTIKVRQNHHAVILASISLAETVNDDYIEHVVAKLRDGSHGNQLDSEVTLIAAANMHALEPREYLVIEPGTSVSPEIRQQVDDEHLYILNDSSWIEDINPVTAYGDPTEVLIDVAAERQRLQTNAALGRPASFGPFEGYIVVEEEKALLEDIF